MAERCLQYRAHASAGPAGPHGSSLPSGAKGSDGSSGGGHTIQGGGLRVGGAGLPTSSLPLHCYGSTVSPKGLCGNPDPSPPEHSCTWRHDLKEVIQVQCGLGWGPDPTGLGPYKDRTHTGLTTWRCTERRPATGRAEGHREGPALPRPRVSSPQDWERYMSAVEAASPRAFVWQPQESRSPAWTRTSLWRSFWLPSCPPALQRASFCVGWDSHPDPPGSQGPLTRLHRLGPSPPGPHGSQYGPLLSSFPSPSC